MSKLSEYRAGRERSQMSSDAWIYGFRLHDTWEVTTTDLGEHLRLDVVLLATGTFATLRYWLGAFRQGHRRTFAADLPAVWFNKWGMADTEESYSDYKLERLIWRRGGRY